jgi:hypothetical protein
MSMIEVFHVNMCLSPWYFQTVIFSHAEPNGMSIISNCFAFTKICHDSRMPLKRNIAFRYQQMISQEENGFLL